MDCTKKYWTKKAMEYIEKNNLYDVSVEKIRLMLLREYNRKWESNNIEHRREYMHRYYITHKGSKDRIERKKRRAIERYLKLN